MYKKIKHIHLIGIGGIGVSSIAEILHRHGYVVSGSDVNRSETIRHLEKLGIRISLGHDPKNLRNAELVVYSSAISHENPELVGARSLGVPVIRRAEMLAELMRIKYGIAVAGAHGKTTTTSMISIALADAGLDPTIIVGGRMDNFGGTNARLGNGEFMVVEADESDGSFNKLSPSIAIVTNIDREHMEYYKTMRNIQKAFLSFLNKVPFYGLCVICGDDPYLKLMDHRITRRKRWFGFGEHNYYRVKSYAPKNGGTICKISIDGKEEELQLKVPGRHNVLNALATLAVAEELSIPRKKILESLYSYEGVQRRFQKRGEKDGVIFVDDYAHHPTEIQHTLIAAREQFPKSKIRAVFQPHRYSRMEDLFDEFSKCFEAIDAVAICPIYAAGEKTIPGVCSSLLAESMQKRGNQHSIHVNSPTEGISVWMRESRPGDLIITLGAGDLPNVYKELF